MQDNTLDDLLLKGRKMWQPRKGYRMGLDAVVLAHFIDVAPGDLVADLGTGAGAIPLLLTARVPDLQICAVEIQSALAQLAKKNMEDNGLSRQVEVLCEDLNNVILHWGEERFQAVVSNPPYYKVGTGTNSPLLQKRIATQEWECTLEQVLITAGRLAAPHGRVALVHRPQRLAEMTALFCRYHLQPVRLRLVHARAGAPASLVLMEGQKAGNGSLEIEPPLIIYDEAGNYSEEVKQMFYQTSGGDND